MHSIKFIYCIVCPMPSLINLCINIVLYSLVKCFSICLFVFKNMCFHLPLGVDKSLELELKRWIVLLKSSNKNQEFTMI